jgi:hypothetical protein
MILKNRITLLATRPDSLRCIAGKQQAHTHVPSAWWWIPVDGKITRDERALSLLTFMALVAGLKRF